MEPGLEWYLGRVEVIEFDDAKGTGVQGRGEVLLGLVAIWGMELLLKVYKMSEGGYKKRKVKQTFWKKKTDEEVLRLKQHQLASGVKLLEWLE
jgi:hypothetical protein